MITYAYSAEDISPGQLNGFFEGWPNPPSAETHLQLLRCSYKMVLAQDSEAHDVVGFITAISDGILSAYIPLLEVLPAYRGRGIGSELTRRMLEQLKDFYMVDLISNPNAVGFYERLGMQTATGMTVRNFDRQSGTT
jgi:ribosomal protein S18 acetylase RimI-like enzyme